MEDSHLNNPKRIHQKEKRYYTIGGVKLLFENSCIDPVLEELNLRLKNLGSEYNKITYQKTLKS